MSHRGKIVLLPPNRVWRTYLGGRELDRLAGSGEKAVDGSFPEDWVGSVTQARNAGRDEPGEGLSRVLVGGVAVDLATLLAEDPIYHLGEAHVRAHGSELKLLVKLIDSAIRLHFQVHPTTAFAQRRMGAAAGKTEAYHVLATRPGVEGKIYLGFQRPPERAGLRRMIEAQDMAGIEACFDPITVRPGDTYLVPGGTPHALGAGVLLVELQEPSDLVVRFEFERGGYVLPEEARFMGRGLDFCLDVFDFTAIDRAKVMRENRCEPTLGEEPAEGVREEILIGPERTPCFRLQRTVVEGRGFERVTNEARIVIVTAGACVLKAGGETHRLGFGDKVFLPAGLGALKIEPQPTCTLLECLPPLP